MKKFKIKDSTTLNEIEEELKRMKSVNANEFELSDIIKIAEFLGCTYLGGCGGTQVRFTHPAIKMYGNFFGVHIIHGRKVETIKKNDFKTFIFPHLMTIIEYKKNSEL